MKLARLLGLFVLASAFGLFHHVQAQQPYVRGANCVESANCANCLTMSISDSNCPSGVQCRSAQSSTAQSTFKTCVQSSNSQHQCFIQTLDPAITCQSMNYWNCGCKQSSTVSCDYSSCPCSGTPAGTADGTVNVKCT